MRVGCVRGVVVSLRAGRVSDVVGTCVRVDRHHYLNVLGPPEPRRILLEKATLLEKVVIAFFRQNTHLFGIVGDKWCGQRGVLERSVKSEALLEGEGDNFWDGNVRDGPD